jgi:glycosyltransferase involved in cell wall biosynthesis
MTKKVSILIPVYNEERSLHNLYDALLPLIDNKLHSVAYDWEVLLVNDGSADNSLALLRELHAADARIRYISLSRNFGKEDAMLAGMDNVTGDCTIIMDADLQHPVNIIPQMLTEWEAGYDDVYGQRITRGKESWLRRKFSLCYYSLLKRSTRIEILPNVGDFRLLDKRVVNAMRSMRESQRYTKGLYCWVGYNKKAVLFEQHDRTDGVSSFNFHRLFNLAIDGVTSYTVAPLRIASVAGFVAAMLALLYMVFIIAKTILVGEPIQGFPTLICVILFLGGCQLLAIGICGEYIGRIFIQSKGRPPYFISEKDGEKV